MIITDSTFRFIIDQDYIINVIVWGEWVDRDIPAFKTAFEECLDYVTEHGHPRLILYDTRNLGSLYFANAKLRGEMVDVFQHLEFDEVVDFGGSPALKLVIRMIGKICPNVARAKFFRTEKKAREYLLRRQSELTT